MIDYGEFQSAIGLNWYDIDPNLQLQMRRLLDPADLDWLEPELRKIGALCGGPVAARAEVTDKHPPEFFKFDLCSAITIDTQAARVTTRYVVKSVQDRESDN
jgi:hypothetical protein